MNSIDVRSLIHLFGQEIYLVINKLLVETLHKDLAFLNNFASYVQVAHSHLMGKKCMCLCSILLTQYHA